MLSWDLGSRIIIEGQFLRGSLRQAEKLPEMFTESSLDTCSACTATVLPICFHDVFVYYRTGTGTVLPAPRHPAGISVAILYGTGTCR